MAEIVQVEGDRGPHGWIRLDMAPLEHAVHQIAVVSISGGAASTLVSHPGGLWAAMGLFVLIGVIPVAVLLISMIRGLLKDERVAKLNEKVRALERERAADRKRIGEVEDILRRNNLA